jgi:hypothetical protein
MCRLLPASLLATLLLAVPALAGDETPTFEKDVRPILKAACFHCHGEEAELAGGLDLRLVRLMTRGGDSGPAITPGNPAESYLLDRLKSHEMPPADADSPLGAKQIATLERWIAAGARTARPEPETIGTGLVINEEDRNWWSFRPVQRPAVPIVRNVDRVESPIDAFVLARLEAAGLDLAAPAERRTLIRRLSFDLRGFPPTPDEVERFLADTAPDADARLVDRLLDDPAYGERWGRHWLDVAGYADSEGVTEIDRQRKWAWRYRDYVVRAFNDDKPFDTFVREQLAGDELAELDLRNLTADDTERLVATGFLRTAPDGTQDRKDDAELARNEVVADTLEIVTTSLLGLTVNCAQCHEHRYDPIPQADYYALRAVLEPALDWRDWRDPSQRLVSLQTDADRARAAEIEAEAKAVEAERTTRQDELVEATFRRELAKVSEEERPDAELARNTPEKERDAAQQELLRKYPSLNVAAGSLRLFDKQAAAELAKFTSRAAAIRARKPPLEYVRALVEPANHVPQTFVFHRGDHEQPKEAVPPAGLTVLRNEADTLPADDARRPTTGRRLAFADRLVSGEHPLVARVFVNRVWQHHFGRGIVETPGDFGRLGSPPSHPELLDWLADEFVRGGWSVKHLHRRILLSAAYRQSSHRSPEQRAADPDNRLLGNFPLRRIDAETLRDSILAVGGRLNRKPYGPPVPVMADTVGQWVIGKENLNAGRPGPVLPMNGEDLRRSLYVEARRSRPLAVLATFDLPRMDPHCNLRATSTVAPQSLLLVNGEFVVEESTVLADRLIADGADAPSRVTRAWQLVLSRDPTADELVDATTFLAEQSADLKSRIDPKQNGTPDRAALASLCQVLIGSNEFLYVD